jgi:hypothetical protein
MERWQGRVTDVVRAVRRGMADAAAPGSENMWGQRAAPKTLERFRADFEPAVLYSIYWLLFSARLYPAGYSADQIPDVTAKADTWLRLVKMRLESEAFISEFTKAVSLPPPTSSAPPAAKPDAPPAGTFPGLYL